MFRFDALIRLHATGAVAQLPGAWEVAEIIGCCLRQLASDASRPAPVRDARQRILGLLETIATDPSRPFPAVEKLARRTLDLLSPAIPPGYRPDATSLPGTSAHG